MPAVPVSSPDIPIPYYPSVPENSDGVQSPRTKGALVPALVVFAVGLILWWGSFYPDPFYYGGGYGERALLKKVPTLLHFIIPGVTFLISVGIAVGMVTRVRVALCAVGVTLGVMMLGVVFAGYKLFRAQPVHRRLESYHSFLQLNPPETQNHRQLFTSSAPASEGRGLTLAFLGGSTTEFTDSAGVGWPTKVGKRIAAALPGDREPKAISVINAGRQWYSSLHIMQNYLTNVRPMKPDVIVFMEAINDLFYNASFSYLSKGEFRTDYGHYMGAASRLLTGQNGLSDLISHARGAFFSQPRNLISHAPLPGLDSYVRNIETLIEIARIDGTRVVLVTQPSIYRQGLPEEEAWRLSMLNFEGIGPKDRWTVEAVEEGMVRYNQALRLLAARRAVPVIELETRLPKNYEIFSDDVHYTDQGHELVAGAMTEGLLPFVLIQDGGQSK